MTRRTRTVLIETAAAVAIGVPFLLVAACGDEPAEADTRKPPGWQVVVPNNPDTYDVETFCDHGNRVYLSATGARGIAVAAQDPSCAGVSQ